MNAFNFDNRQVALANAYVHASAIERANADAVQSKQELAEQALGAIQNKNLTLDTLKDEMIEIARSAMAETDAEAAKSMTGLNDCHPTWKSWYYDIAKVAKAGDDHVAKVVNGEAITTVRRNLTKPTAGNGGNSSPKAKTPNKDKGVTIGELTSTLNSMISTVMDSDNKWDAVKLANEPGFADLLTDLTLLQEQAHNTVSELMAQQQQAA